MKIQMVLLSVLLIGCQTNQIDQEAEAQKLLDISQKWAEAAKSGDAEQTLSFWSKDAIVMTDGEGIVKGHDQIREMLTAEGSAEVEFYWNPTEAFVSKGGDLGYVLNKVYISFPDSLGMPIKTFHKGVEIWKKQEDGSWKCVVDIMNSDPTLTSIFD